MADPRCHGLGLDARCPGCLDCCGRESCPGCAACDDSRDDGASSSPGVSPSAAGAAGPARAAGVGGGDAPAPAVREAILDAVSELRRQSLKEVAPTSTSLLHTADRLLGVLDTMPAPEHTCALPAPAVRDPSEPTPEDAAALARQVGRACTFAAVSDLPGAVGVSYCSEPSYRARAYARTAAGWRRLGLPQAAPSKAGLTDLEVEAVRAVIRLYGVDAPMATTRDVCLRAVEAREASRG